MFPLRILAQGTVKEAEQLSFAQGLLSRGIYDMAILQYRKFIADYPQSPSLPEAYLSLGEGYFLSQDFDRAIEVYDQFIQLFPNSDQLPVVILRLGQIDIQEKKYDEALKEFALLDPSKPLKASMLQSFDYYTAQAYMGQGDAANALALYQKAAQVEGASDYTAYAYKEIGMINAQNSQYAKAMDAYDTASKLAMDDALKGELVYRVAELEFMSGKYADAINGFGQVIDKYAGLGFSQDALANMLLAYFNLGQYDGLIKVYQQKSKGLKNDEADFAIHFAAVMAYIELNQYDKATVLMDRMLGLTGLKAQERAKIFLKKADILIREKKYKDGLSLVETYGQGDVDDADEASFIQAQAYYGLGDFDHAFNFFEKVYLHFPNSRFYNAALLGQAHARKATGRFKESEILFLKYVGDQPVDQNKEALYDAVMMALKAQDLSGAVRGAEEYLKAFPNDEKYSEIMLILANCYGTQNRSQDAVKLLQEYLSKAGAVKTNAANFLLGYYEQQLGDTNQALAAYAQVDEHKDNGEYYPAALKNLAIIYLGRKNFDQARDYFDRLINQASQNDLKINTYVWVCNEYLKKEKYDEVLRVVTQARKNFPQQDVMEISYFRAEALRGKNECEEANKEYAAVMASPNKNAFSGSAHIGYGLCLESDRQFDEAKKEFQVPLNENADDYTVSVHARFELANLDLTQGDLNEALKIYLLVATIYDDQYYCPESLLKAARICERLHRQADAFKLYSEILDKYKNSSAANTAKQRIRLLK